MVNRNIKKIIFGLGSNLNDRQKNLDQAANLLVRKLDLKNLKKSQIYVNKALLKKDAPKEWDIDFFNLAISADIDLAQFSLFKILSIIKEIESSIGRIHNDDRTSHKNWAPREIDIDILAIDDLVIDYNGEDYQIYIPHNGLLERDFFIKTMAEIEPNWLYPIKNEYFGKKISDFLKK